MQIHPGGGVHFIVKLNTQNNLVLVSCITKMGENFINLFFQEYMYTIYIT